MGSFSQSETPKERLIDQARTLIEEAKLLPPGAVRMPQSAQPGLPTPRPTSTIGPAPGVCDRRREATYLEAWPG